MKAPTRIAERGIGKLKTRTRLNQDMTASLADDMMRFYDGTVVVVGS